MFFFLLYEPPNNFSTVFGRGDFEKRETKERKREERYEFSCLVERRRENKIDGPHQLFVSLLNNEESPRSEHYSSTFHFYHCHLVFLVLYLVPFFLSFFFFFCQEEVLGDTTISFIFDDKRLTICGPRRM